MKTQLKINGEMKDVEIKDGNITILDSKREKTGWEENTIGCNHYIDCLGRVDFTKGTVALHDIANLFGNKGLAANVAKAQALQRKFWRWQSENDVPHTIKPTIKQWGIEYYSSSPHCLKPIPNGSYHMWGLPYFSSAKKAKEFIETYKDDLLWLFTEFKWRMDG